MEEEKSRKTRIYTIRGLDPETYERFSKLAREIGISIGELMNEAMRSMMAVLEIGTRAGELGVKAVKESIKGVKEAVKEVRDFEVISGIDELEVSREDLEGLEKPVVFMNMKKLVFSDDVDAEIIKEKVKSIKLVDEVVIPKSVPKLLVAKKCSMVKRIVSKS